MAGRQGQRQVRLGAPAPEAFVEWFETEEAQIARVAALLSEELSDNPGRLTEQLVKAEAWYARMTSILAWANSYLDAAERRELLARDKEITDLDRQIRLADAVKDERRVRDVLDGMVGAIKNRLILGMSLMKAQGGERITPAGRAP